MCGWCEDESVNEVMNNAESGAVDECDVKGEKVSLLIQTQR